MPNRPLSPDRLHMLQRGGLAATFRTTRRSGKLYFNTVDAVIRWPDRADRIMAGQKPAPGAPPAAIRSARLQRFTEAMAVASFMLETRTGRDAIAADVLNTVEKLHDRKRFDGLLATVLLHLHATGSKDADRGLKLWSATTNTAQGEHVAVFDARTNRLQALPKIAFNAANGLFGRGLERNTVFDTPGSDVMESDTCGLVFEGLSMLAGEINIGAAAAVSVVGHVICGGGEAEPGGNEGAHGNTGSPAEDMHEAAPEKQQSGGDDDDKPPPDDNGGWPNPEEGYPAPDDGGGSPWSSVGVAMIPTRGDVTALMTPAANGGYDVTRVVTALHADTNAINPNASLITTLLQTGSAQVRARAHLADFARQFKIPSIETATLPSISTKLGAKV